MKKIYSQMKKSIIFPGVFIIIFIFYFVSYPYIFIFLFIVFRIIPSK